MEEYEEISLVENFCFVHEMTLGCDKGHVRSGIWCVCLTILQAQCVQLIPGSELYICSTRSWCRISVMDMRSADVVPCTSVGGVLHDVQFTVVDS